METSSPPFVCIAVGVSGRATCSSATAAGTASSASRLTYQLYGDSGSGGACSVVWGNGTGATSTVGGSLLIVLLGSNINRQVCGTLPANQVSATPGGYSDTV